jgi:hypothetical protein
VASGLILRFDNLDCITNNTTRFADEFVDGGSIISFGEHSFYVVVPESLPDEVTLFSDPLCDEDSCCSDNFDLGAMAEVLMTGAEEGADLLCTGSPSLECIPPESAATSQPQVHDTLDLAIQGLRTPLITSDLAEAAKELEQVRLALLNEANEIADTRRRVDSTVREYNIVHRLTPAGDGPSNLGRVQQ